MPDVAKVRDLLKVMRMVAPYLADEEIREIGIVLLKALKRMESEATE